MSRMPRMRLVLAAVALLTLLAVPMAGARPVSAPSLHSVDGDWLGATLRWVEELVGLRQAGHSVRPGTKAPRNTKEESSSTNVASSGGCIDPLGRPRPCL